MNKSITPSTATPTSLKDRPVLPFKRTPPGALLLAHMTTPPPGVRELVPSVSRQTSQAILKAMAKNPDDRFPSAREFAQALK
ncbi:MAG: hypothetical protein AUJ21_03220 [Anaerolineae bacterium CG1_02_58_13]|nr:MAG: hypothetical protein AUJ21_03220 [Anaerolineae bacterium CG1_02_58_13]